MIIYALTTYKFDVHWSLDRGVDVGDMVVCTLEFTDKIIMDNSVCECKQYSSTLAIRTQLLEAQFPKLLPLF